MKIVNTNIPTTKRFDELQIGDVFQGKSETYYIKIKPVEVVIAQYSGNYMDMDIELHNAICLINGNTTRFISSTQVTPVNCELVIK